MDPSGGNMYRLTTGGRGRVANDTATGVGTAAGVGTATGIGTATDPYGGRRQTEKGDLRSELWNGQETRSTTVRNGDRSEDMLHNGSGRDGGGGAGGGRGPPLFGRRWEG